jgi:hypothetical protein
MVLLNLQGGAAPGPRSAGTDRPTNAAGLLARTSQNSLTLPCPD